MRTFRVVLVNFILVVLVSFLSFASLYVYQTMPEIHNLMNSVDKNMNVESLVRQSFLVFGMLLLFVYVFYFLVFYLLIKQKPNTNRIVLALGIIVILVILDLLTDKKNCKFSTVTGSFISIMVIGAIGLSARSIVEYFNEKDAKKELEKKNLQSELGLLRSQINPHFLFNTLNNIDALIRKDPGRASEVLIKLSVQMRYMLYDSNTDTISLKSELEFIKDYISLQKLRIKNQNAVELLIQGNPGSYVISPMLFISFIENAFKHCTNREQDGAIKISFIFEEGNQLKFSSSNIFVPANVGNKDSSGGIGLDLVRRRLDLLYAGKYKLDIKQENELFIVNLNIQLNDH
ncbi:MAG TPA: histidine kinase [Bacteroidales bacterium]|nr:histidine kinase [Bacteroidales bacterium]